MWVFDKTTLKILAANEAAVLLYGYSAEEFRGLSLMDVRPAEDVPAFLEARQEGGAPRHAGVWRHQRKDGSIFYVDINSSALVFEGQPARMAIMLDVTERMEVEEKLRTSEGRLRAIIEHEPQCVKTVSADGFLLQMNPAGLRLIEADHEGEVRGRSMLELVHPDDHAAFEQLHRQASRGEPGQLQFRVVSLKGTERWVETYSVALPEKKGANPVLSVARDITQQRHAEEAVRTQADMLDQIAPSVIATDMAGKVIYANRAAGELYGWRSLVEMRGTDIIALTVPQSSQAEADEIMAQVARGEKWSGEFVCRRHNGSEFQAFCTTSPLLSKEGQRVGSIGTSTDITGRKEAEAALRRREADLKNAQRIAHLGSWHCEIPSGEVKWSDEVYRIFGVSPETFRPSYEGFFRAIPPADRAVVRAACEAALAGGAIYSIDHRIARPDGTVRVVHGHGEVTFDQLGKATSIAGTIQDITERKEAEAAASRLLSVLEASLNEIYIFDAETLRFDYVNECARQNLGYSMEQMRAQTPVDLKPEFTTELFHEMIGPLRRHEKPKILFETVHRRADASLYPVEVHLQLVERAEKNVFLAVINDITARKRTEEELRQKDNLIRIASRMTETGGWALEIATQQVFWSDGVCDILGYPRGTVPPLAEGLALYPHPWRGVVQAGLEACARDGTPFDAEVEVLTKNGRQISARLCCEAERDAAGIITHVQGAFQDITRRRRAEAALRQAHTKYRSLVENAVEGIFQTTPEGAFLSANPALARMAGYDSPDEFIRERNALDGHSHADPARRQEFYRLMAAQGFVNDFEYDTKRKDGSIVSVSESTRIVRDDAGHALYYEGSARDITGRKRAEAELEELNRQLVETSRQAGMAEVATSVLHNVGNVLNSVNVSCSVISDTVRKSRISTVHKTAALLRQHAEDLPAFLTTDPAGKKLPELLGKLAQRLADEQATVLSEAQALTENVAHIADIVAVQQSYAGKIGGIRETLGLDKLMEDALRMTSTALVRHRVEVVREFSEVPTIPIEKHKVLQILVNLIRNAKHALTDSRRADKRLLLRIGASSEHVTLVVADNGIGIAPENMTRIFAHGFTTKKDGHGFGLHSGALAAQEMGGSLKVQSDGIGHGATFTLELPRVAGGETP